MLSFDSIKIDTNIPYVDHLKKRIHLCSVNHRKGNYEIPIVVIIESLGRLDADVLNLSIENETDPEYKNVCILKYTEKKSEIKFENWNNVQTLLRNKN